MFKILWMILLLVFYCSATPTSDESLKENIADDIDTSRDSGTEISGTEKDHTLLSNFQSSVPLGMVYLMKVDEGNMAHENLLSVRLSTGDGNNKFPAIIPAHHSREKNLMLVKADLLDLPDVSISTHEANEKFNLDLPMKGGDYGLIDENVDQVDEIYNNRRNNDNDGQSKNINDASNQRLDNQVMKEGHDELQNVLDVDLPKSREVKKCNEENSDYVSQTLDDQRTTRNIRRKSKTPELEQANMIAQSNNREQKVIDVDLSEKLKKIISDLRNSNPSQHLQDQEFEKIKGLVDTDLSKETEKHNNEKIENFYQKNVQKKADDQIISRPSRNAVFLRKTLVKEENEKLLQKDDNLLTLGNLLPTVGLIIG
ncbi:uncharacterized protein LOC142330290 [Lycorma delicatula]|uniref:uncharacterized protein LOC142330290 n=1 Tax=Lycorma delicatula TaxID=130591 RepID=UPI003F51331B